MTNLIVHVGPHKTATTSLQHFLYNNRDALQKRGVCYPIISPDVPNKINHNDLALAMSRGDTGAANTFIEAVADLGAGSATTILSGEEFSSCVNQNMPVGIKALERRFSGVRYVFVDRDAVSRFASATIHNLADNRQAIFAHGTFGKYLAALSLFSRRQRKFYEERATIFLNFDHMVSENIGRAFLATVLGFQFDGEAVTANVGKNYTDRIIALPAGERRKIAEFVSGNSEDADTLTDSSGVLAFVRSNIENVLGSVPG